MGESERKKESEVTQLCPSLCDPMNCSLPGSSVHGIFQARILEWDAISFSKVSSQPRDQTQVSALQADALPSEPAGKPPKLGKASTLAWKIPWTEEPGRLQSMGSLRVGHV